MVETLKRREIHNDELEAETAKLLKFLNDNGANITIETELYATQIAQRENIFNAAMRFGTKSPRIVINIYEQNAATFDLYGFLDYMLEDVSENDLEDSTIDERYKYAYAHYALSLSDVEDYHMLYELLHDSMINNHAHVRETLDPLIESGELNTYYDNEYMQDYKDDYRNQYKNVSKQQLFIKDLLTKYERGLKR